MNKSFTTTIWNLLTVSLLMSFLLECCSVAGAGSVSPEAKNCFEWFNGLGFPDVKGCQFVCVTVKWSDPKGKWPAQHKSRNAFLLTGDPDAFMVLDLELFRRSYPETVQRTSLQTKASYKPADLKNEAAAFLNRINSLKHGEDLFDRLEERISIRVYTFVLAWACWRNGLNDEAEKLYQASKHLRYGIEEVDENNFQRVLEEEISYAVMWRAVIDFGNISISRPKLLSEFQNFIRHYPGSSHQERAKQTAAMLTRMIAEDDVHAKTAPTNLAVLPVEEQVRELIFQLRDQHGEQGMQPGWCDIFADWHGQTNSPAHQLVRIGYPAVPQLITTLEDPTFTRSVGYWRDFTFSHNVLTVGDCAMEILGRITGKYFYVPTHTAGYMSTDKQVSQTHQRAEAWWAEFQKKGEKQMLVEGVEAGDDNAISEANRLVAHYPDAASAALVKGIHVATSATVAAGMSEDMRVRRAANIRKALIGIFQKCDSNAAQTFLQKELHEGNDDSRVSAAEVLIQSNRDDVIKAMIQEWQNSPDYKVEQDQGWTECARFLASVDSPQAIQALGKNFQARPLNTRMVILHNVGEGGTLYGEIRPITDRPTSADAIGSLLITLLEDTGQQPGDSGPRLGRHYRDVRICDMAGYYLNQLWPARYHFDLSDSWAARWQHRIECQNTWRLAHKQAALRSPFTDAPPFDGDRKKIAAVYWLPGSLKPTPALANCFSNLQNEDLSAAYLKMLVTEFCLSTQSDAAGLELEIERKPKHTGVKLFVNIMPGTSTESQQYFRIDEQVWLRGQSVINTKDNINCLDFFKNASPLNYSMPYYSVPPLSAFFDIVKDVFDSAPSDPFKISLGIYPIDSN